MLQPITPDGGRRTQDVGRRFINAGTFALRTRAAPAVTQKSPPPEWVARVGHKKAVGPETHPEPGNFVHKRHVPPQQKRKREEEKCPCSSAEKVRVKAGEAPRRHQEERQLCALRGQRIDQDLKESRRCKINTNGKLECGTRWSPGDLSECKGSGGGAVAGISGRWAGKQTGIPTQWPAKVVSIAGVPSF